MRKMGKGSYQAAMEGTQEIGLAVLATTLSIVAVFLPIGFMGGIIGKFFHEFGITIVAAVLISMFVSFTLDPMLSSIWEDPSIHAHGKRVEDRSLYGRTIGRVTGWFDDATERLAQGYQKVLGWALVHKLKPWRWPWASLCSAWSWCRCWAPSFPRPTSPRPTINFYVPVGASIEATEAKTRQVEAVVRELPEVRYTLSTINTGSAQGKIYASVYVRLVDRKQRHRSVDEMSGVLRERLRQIPGITVTHVGLLDPVGGQKQIEFSLQGPDLQELARLTRAVQEKIHPFPAWWTSIRASARQTGDRRRCAATRPLTWACRLRNGQQPAHSDCRADRRQLARPDDQTYDVNVRLRPKPATRRKTWSACPLPWPMPTAAAASCA